MSDNSAEKAGVYQKLYESQVAKFNQSRLLEWKVNATLWFLLILAVPGSRFIPACPVTRIALIALATLIHYQWMKLFHASQAADFGVALRYRHECEKVLNPKFIVTEPDPKKRPTKDREWILLPVLVTALLASFAFGATLRGAETYGRACAYKKSACPFMSMGRGFCPKKAGSWPEKTFNAEASSDAQKRADTIG